MFHPDELVTVSGQYVCSDCLSDFCKRESKVEDNIRGFLQEKESEYLWWLFTGDAFVSDVDKLEALRQWYSLWKTRNGTLSILVPGRWPTI